MCADLRLVVFTLLVLASSLCAEVPVDTSEYRGPASGIDVRHVDAEWRVGWLDGSGGRVTIGLELENGKPLFKWIEAGPKGLGSETRVLEAFDPVFFLTVGERRTPPAKPGDQKWRVFFDNPARRDSETHVGQLKLERVRMKSHGQRLVISIETLELGSFSGRIEITVFASSPLVKIEAVVRTKEDRRAIFYDAGLVGGTIGEAEIFYRKARPGRRPFAGARREGGGERIPARERAIAATSKSGSVVLFPPPHQFFFPRDYSDNLGFVWTGEVAGAQRPGTGFGVCQAETGGGNYVPWFNAPPNVDHRLGAFLVATRKKGLEALTDVSRYSRGDRFEKMPGHVTFTTHWHMAITVAAMKQKADGVDPLPVPSFVDIFKSMGVDMVHLGEFHGDGHQKDGGELRLSEMQGMFDECRRLSDEELLLIPGEEVNTYLGVRQPRRHPGHWMSLFPKPVHWILKRGEEQPFVSVHPKYGKVYRVGSRQDMERLIEAEDALVWVAHPRIKASSWTPDIFRRESFYLRDSWLGGAWKSMPGDLSHDRLGKGTLGLLDDMANWGQRKYMPGEVDVFKIDPSHELWGHMNINYLRLDRIPRFEEGWKPVLDALRSGAFFVTTGEVLIRDFRVGDKESGEELPAAEASGAELVVDLDWTFPLAFAEVISGDGGKVHRERIDLSTTGELGRETIRRKLQLDGRKWVRFEVWDVAQNGAFTQPVWIE